jgi:hypothetical protein
MSEQSKVVVRANSGD